MNQRKTLIVVDMQNDFIDGALGTAEAVAILPAAFSRVAAAVQAGDEIIFTRDTHTEAYMQTSEGRHLPVPHCLKGTPGWEIREGLYVPGAEIIDKPSFGWTGWDGRGFTDVTLIGLCTDICVVSNALILKALYPEAEISVDASCCAGVTPDTHKAALDTMRCCQINVIGG